MDADDSVISAAEESHDEISGIVTVDLGSGGGSAVGEAESSSSIPPEKSSIPSHQPLATAERPIQRRNDEPTSAEAAIYEPERLYSANATTSASPARIEMHRMSTETTDFVGRAQAASADDGLVNTSSSGSLSEPLVLPVKYRNATASGAGPSTVSNTSGPKLTESLAKDFLAITGSTVDTPTHANTNDSTRTNATAATAYTTGSTVTSTRSIGSASTAVDQTNTSREQRRRLFLQKTGEVARRVWERVNPNLEMCLCNTAVKQIEAEESFRQSDDRWVGTPTGAAAMRDAEAAASSVDHTLAVEVYRRFLFDEDVTRSKCEDDEEEG